MSDLLRQFIDAMKAAGCGPANTSDIITDDVMRDYQIDGDARGRKKGYYVLRLDDGFGVGGFADRRMGEWHTWTSRSGKNWTDAEKQAWKQRRDDAQAKQIEQRRHEQDLAATASQDKWKQARAAPHDYLKRKGVGGAGTKVLDGDLLVPMVADGKIWGVQAISPDGTKMFPKGARKQGCYAPLAKTTDSKSVIVLAEGYATAASIRAAFPKVPVLCCFDAGNLAHVAEAKRREFPESRFVFAADNDQFTTIKGEPVNVGIEKARQAAAKIGGAGVIWPEFPDDVLDQKPTDFNDAHQLLGLSYVQDRLRSLIENPPTPSDNEKVGSPSDEATASKETNASAGSFPPAAREAAASDPQSSQIVDAHTGGRDALETEIDAEADDEQNDLIGFNGMPFRVLGYNGPDYYYFPFAKQQIVSLTASGHTLNNLLQLGALSQWETNFMGAGITHKNLPTFAANAMFAKAHEIGVFQVEDKVRGAGVWTDAGRIVLHCGDRLIVDRKPMPPKLMTSAYVYVAANRVFTVAKEGLNDQQASRLRTICGLPTWENPLSGILLAGWLVTAPICGALDWRPHIWIHGESESGKSSIMTKIVRPIIGPIGLNVDGTTTESSIRNTIVSDARPVIFDEAEGRKGLVSSMDGVLQLARLASSGGTVRKYGQRPFTARSSFCFSAINPPIKDFADETRISKMNLLKNRSPNAQLMYDDMLALIDEVITPDYSKRLLTRTILNMPTLMKNIATLRRAAREETKGARAADQISVMLAGWWLLGTTDLITPDEARALVAQHTWDDHTAINQDPDPVRLVHHIATSILHLPKPGGGSIDATVGELIMAALNEPNPVVTPDYADRILRQHAIVAKDKGISIGASNQNLAKLLRGTDWEINWCGMLINYEGAEKISSEYFSAGEKKQRAVRLPLTAFYDKPVQETFYTKPISEDIAF